MKEESIKPISCIKSHFKKQIQLKVFTNKYGLFPYYFKENSIVKHYKPSQVKWILNKVRELREDGVRQKKAKEYLLEHSEDYRAIWQESKQNPRAVIKYTGKDYDGFIRSLSYGYVVNFKSKYHTGEAIRKGDMIVLSGIGKVISIMLKDMPNYFKMCKIEYQLPQLSACK